MATRQLSPPLRPIDRAAGTVTTLVTLMLVMTGLITMMAVLSA